MLYLIQTRIILNYFYIVYYELILSCNFDVLQINDIANIVRYL